MTRTFHWFFMWKWIPCQTVTSVLNLLFRPKTVHCNTKNAYSTEITFLALVPWKIQHLYISIFSLPLIRQTKSFLFCLSHGKLTVLFCLWHGKLTVLFCLWQGKLNVLFFGSHGFLNSEPSEINIIFCKINRKLGR